MVTGHKGSILRLSPCVEHSHDEHRPSSSINARLVNLFRAEPPVNPLLSDIGRSGTWPSHPVCDLPKRAYRFLCLPRNRQVVNVREAFDDHHPRIIDGCGPPRDIDVVVLHRTQARTLVFVSASDEQGGFLLNHSAGSAAITNERPSCSPRDVSLFAERIASLDRGHVWGRC